RDRADLEAADEKLAGKRAEERMRRYEEGTVRALCLAMTADEFNPQEHRRRGRAACEEALGLYGVLDRDDWQEQPDWLRLAPADRQRLGEDTRELLLVLARARCGPAPADRDELRRSLALVDRAEAVAGLAPSPALLAERAYYLDQVGDATRARVARAA